MGNGRDNGSQATSSELDSKKEFQRQLDYQIEQIRHYENRGDRILRIFLASLGLIVTGIGMLVSTSGFTLDYFLSLGFYSDEKIGNLILALVSLLGITKSGAALILVVIVLGGIALTTIAFIPLFFLGLYETWKVIQPSDATPTALPIGEGRVVADYKDVVDENGGILTSKRNGLARAQKLITGSVLLFFSALFMLTAPIAFESPELALGSLLVLLWIVVTTAYNRISFSAVLDHAKLVKYPDTAYVGILVMVHMSELTGSFTIGNQIAEILLWTFMGAAIFGCGLVPYSRIKKYWLRNFSLFIFLLLIRITSEIFSTKIIWNYNSSQSLIWYSFLIPTVIVLVGSTIGVLGGFILQRIPDDSLSSSKAILKNIKTKIIQAVPFYSTRDR